MALAHDLFVSGPKLRQAGVSRLVLNATAWLARERPGARIGLIPSRRWRAPPRSPAGLSQGAPSEDDALLEALRRAGYRSARALTLDPLDLSDVDVVIWGYLTHLGSPDDQRRLIELVRAGGGLLVALCPWGTKQLTELDVERDLAWNRVLVPLGLFFSDEPELDPHQGTRLLVRASRPLLGHPGNLLRLLEELGERATLACLDTEREPQLRLTLRDAIATAPPEEPYLLPRARALAADPRTPPAVARFLKDVLAARRK